jgi:hypothetical protein
MPRKPSQSIIAEATEILGGIAFIATKERLVRGTYISEDVDPEFKGSLCQGHRACLIGTTWLAAKVPVEWSYDSYDDENVPNLPYTGHGRNRFVADKPGLALALRALDEAARRYVKRNRASLSEAFLSDWESYQRESAPTFMDEEYLGFGHPAEALFENGLPGNDREIQGEVVKLARAARRLVVSDQVR